MSKLTGVRDFKDFLSQEEPTYLKKLDIYIGYFNYLTDNPIDTKGFDSPKDWAPLYHYTVLSKSLYRNLGSGYVILSNRDYISEQEDKMGGAGYNEAVKKLIAHREVYQNALMDLGYTEEEAINLSKYRFELEESLFHKKEGEENE